MKIKVNGEVVEIFKGAQVKDVIRSYSESEYKKVNLNQSIKKLKKVKKSLKIPMAIWLCLTVN